MAFLRDLQSSARQGGMPVTAAIVGTAAAAFLLSWLSGSMAFGNFAFDPRLLGSQPWSLLTYPFAFPPDGGNFIGVVFVCWWLWGIGGQVERELRAITYGLFFAAMTVLPALFLLIGSSMLDIDHVLAGLYLPVAGVTVAWATRNPELKVLMMMVIPIQAKWIGWLTAGAVLFGYGTGNPLVGVLACIHLVLAWLYAANKVPALGWASGPSSFGSKKGKAWTPREKDDKYLSEVKDRELDRQERERLRRLFEGSLKDDPEDKV